MNAESIGRSFRTGMRYVSELTKEMHENEEFDLAGDALPYIKIAWMEIYKHA